MWRCPKRRLRTRAVPGGPCAPRFNTRTAPGIVKVTKETAAGFSEEDAAVLESVSRVMGACLANGFRFVSERGATGIDPVTGLGNEQALQSQLATELLRIKRHGDPVSLVLLEVDDHASLTESLGAERANGIDKGIADVLHSGNASDIYFSLRPGFLRC